MQKVFVLDHEKQPLMPCRPARARYLLTQQKAAVFRTYPFTIILKDTRPVAVVEPLRLKIDPGSKTTGIALVNAQKGEVVWAAELTHRGQQIKEHLDTRRSCRRNRRQRKTRYRPARFLNRRRSKGWLPPSIRSRIENILTWHRRLIRWCSIGAISLELVRFDTQSLQNPEIDGVEYQQGTLFGYEVREYLLEKGRRKCAYCSKTDIPLQIEHIVPKARGGSNRVTNLTLACQSCNQKKGTKTAEEFGYPKVQAQAKKPLKDAAAVNSTRWALFEHLRSTDLPIETGTGGRTKYNRSLRRIPKTHWLDAACVGESTSISLRWGETIPLSIRATGRHSRHMQETDEHGFPNRKPKETSVVGGYRTGDLVRAVVPNGKYAGVHIGRITIRATGSCAIKTATKGKFDTHYSNFFSIHRGDGYTYQKGERVFLPIP